jgi:lactate permease
MGQLVPPLADALNKVTIAWRFPATSTSLGWHNAAGAGRSISLFGHAGALILYACALGYLAYRRAGAYRSGAFGRIVRDTAADAIRPTGAILALVGMALMMGETGMTSVLARAMANAAGAWFPLVAPFIGALGAFMTGSNTNSNVVFAPLQLETARLLHLSAPWLLAAQNLGGAIGSSFAPAKVIVACSTVGLAKGGEGTVLRRNVAFGLLIVGAGAIVTALIVAHVSG